MGEVVVDVDSAAGVRMARSDERFRQLDDEISAWISENIVVGRGRTASDDRHVIEVFGDIPDAPAGDWSMRFGDAVHDMRSALDYLAQAFCRVEGEEPKRPRQIYFPVASKESDWANKANALATAPESLLERVERVQPFRNPGPKGRALELLHTLDIREKHYDLIRFDPLPVLTDIGQVRDWPAGMSDEGTSGTLLGRVHLDMELGPDVRALWPTPVIPLLSVHRKAAPLLDVQRWLFNTIVDIFEFLLDGKERDQQVAPEPTWVEPTQGE